MLGTDCEKIGCGETAQKLINSILRNSLQSEPDDRYQDAGEMLEDVQRLVEELRPSKNRLSLGLSTLSEGEFLGREEELEQLDMSLRQHRNPIVIWGFGGMGKTELAIEFGRRKMSTCQVYFVRFDTSFYETVVGPIADAFSGYSRYDARGREKTEEQVYEEVMKLLGELSPDDVLIIDNVDSETEEMSELLDDRYRALCGLSLHLIITSRTRCEGYGIEVGELERKELHELMQRFVKISENEMDALIDTVEGHTLTVELIARTLKYSYPPISVEEMLTKLKEGDLDSENLAKVSVRKDRDERKWKIEEHLRCLFRITELPSMELSYLKNAILIDTKKGLYYNWFASACPDFDQNVMIHLLERGWIKLNREENLLTVHPLIQQLVENEINRIPEDSNIFLSRLWKVFEKNRYKYSKKEVDQIAEVFYNALLQKVDYPQWNEWIDGLCYWLDEVIDELKLSIRCKEEILATLRDKNIDEERRLCIMLDNIDILEKIYRGKSNIENEVLAATYNSVANIYIERKDYVNAFCYLKKAAKCKSSTRAINNLGWMYLYGYGCEQDVSQAINIFLYAANSEIKPDKLANRHLGKLYLGVHPAISNEEIIDFEKALYYLERAKQLGADDVDKLIEKAKNMLNDK